MLYLITKRNFEQVPGNADAYEPSSYVNGTLYSYYILEVCQSPPGPPLADSIEFQVDPLDYVFTAVAGFFDPQLTINSGLPYPGKFYTSLTRDDVMGLRYLMRTNNVNWESPPATAVAFLTNTTPELVFTSNLTEFASLALTNPPAALQTLFPNLVILNASNFLANVWVTNVIPVFTNSPYDPASVSNRVVLVTTRTLVAQSQWFYTFGNLFQVVYTNGAWSAILAEDISKLLGWTVSSLQTITVSASQDPFAPAGTFVQTTNVTSKPFATNQIVGEFLILSNACDIALLAPQSTFLTAFTNVLVSGTNVFNQTNTTEFTQQIVTFATNHSFFSLPITCQTGAVAAVQGIEKLTFIRRDFDSLLGAFFTPITNNYTLNTITNSSLRPMRVQRVVTTPDILFGAADLTAGPEVIPAVPIYARGVNFSTNAASAIFYPLLAGPGTIEPVSFVTLNKVGPIFLNSDPNAYSLNDAEVSQFPVWIWGSFDGTTNAPIVYPSGTSMANLENMILMRIQPDTLPSGTASVPYTSTFSGVGGNQPYTWALAPGSPGLPPGLQLSSSGLLAGTPTDADVFDFAVRMTEAGGRFVDRKYTLTINP
jgi:hypothetical protein